MSASKTSRPGRRPDPALRSSWQQTLLRFGQSGLSVSAFCANEGLSLPSFYSWRRRLKHLGGDNAHPTDTPLLPIHILSAPPPVEVLLPGGVLLRLQTGCDLSLVRSLLAALEDQPC